MSNRGPYRIEVKCPIEFLGPLHIGTGQRLSLQTDAPVLRGLDGKAYLPGSSARGVLRDWCERETPLIGVDPRFVNRMFGVVPNSGTKSKPDNDRQGRLTVLDVPLEKQNAEVRDHVRIERDWGAAAHRGKFDQEIVHCPKAELKLIYEGDSEDDPEVALLHCVVEALRQGLLSFGGKTGWGFGWAQGGEATWQTLQRRDPAGLATYLRSRLNGTHGAATTPAKPQLASRPHGKNEPLPWSWLRLKLALQFDGPMLIAGPPRAEMQDGHRLPDAEYLRNAGAGAVLPGSSLRGALHSHADRIVTTLDHPDIAKKLFGYPEEDEDAGKPRSKRLASKGECGLVRVGDGRLIGDAHEIWLDHVAIDRITGFASDAKLFNSLALGSPAFETQVLVRWHHLDREGQLDQESLAAVALLLFALRDAEQGLLWVGSRTTRGYGYLAGMHIMEGHASVVRAKGRQSFKISRDTEIAALAQTPFGEEILDQMIGAWQQRCGLGQQESAA